MKARKKLAKPPKVSAPREAHQLLERLRDKAKADGTARLTIDEIDAIIKCERRRQR